MPNRKESGSMLNVFEFPRNSSVTRLNEDKNTPLEGLRNLKSTLTKRRIKDKPHFSTPKPDSISKKTRNHAPLTQVGSRVALGSAQDISLGTIPQNAANAAPSLSNSKYSIAKTSISPRKNSTIQSILKRPNESNPRQANGAVSIMDNKSKLTISDHSDYYMQSRNVTTKMELSS